MSKNLSAIIDDELFAKLSELAEKEHRTRSQMVTVLLREALATRAATSTGETENQSTIMPEKFAKTPRYSGKRVTVTIPVEKYEKLHELAEQESRTISSLCAAILIEKLEELGL